MGSHRNRVLQEEWKEFGSENFEFMELEILEPDEDPTYNPAEDLHVLEALLVEKLSPFGDKGCKAGYKSLAWCRVSGGNRFSKKYKSYQG